MSLDLSIEIGWKKTVRKSRLAETAHKMILSKKPSLDMKRLILMRHAKTEAWYEGVDDHARALTERGRQDALLVADALETADWAPDRVIVSTAQRARETWVAMSRCLPRVEVLEDDGLYLADPGDIETVIERAGPCDTLALVGHNPGMHQLACELARLGGYAHDAAYRTLEAKMPTGCAALFEAEADTGFTATAFQLIETLTPRDLRAAPLG